MAGDARVESTDDAGNDSEQPDPGKGEPKADKAPAGSPSSKSDVALMSSWNHLPDPRRPYWAAWHLSKVVSALILGFAAILLLQQINLVTPGGSDDSALGLGFASMEIVFAVAVITGYFSNRMVEWLSKRATRYFGADS